MRRTIMNVTLASLLGFALAGCADKTFPTSPTSPVFGARADAGKPPGGGGTQPPGPPLPPPPTLGPDDFYDITAGDNHTCARKGSGTVYCWGIDDNGQAGAMYPGTCSNGVLCVNQPTHLTRGGVLVAAIQLDAGSNHTCMLDISQDAYCWGDGYNGQVGFGAIGPQSEPTKVNSKEKFQLIGAGGQTSCASGTTGVYCWGVINSTVSPTIIDGYGSTQALAVGDIHVCIIDNSGSHGILCLGSNAVGQLGIDPPAQTWYRAFTPSWFGRANSVTSQLSFTCSDQIDGTVQCAGNNTFGQLGSSAQPFSGIPQTVGGGASLHGVSTGPEHACALDRNGLAFCWGSGDSGKLGNGTQTSSSTPQPVSGGRTYRAIAAGGHHTCAIGADNAIYCWGANQFGQLGERTSSAAVATTPFATAALK